MRLSSRGTTVMHVLATAALLAGFAVPAAAQSLNGAEAATAKPTSSDTESVPAAPTAAVTGPSDNAEQVRAMHSVITVNADGTIDVTERIEYTLPAGRHGIYRDLPLRYQNDQGERYSIPLTFGTVTADGDATVPVKKTENKNGVRLHIGWPDRTTSGTHEYSISYVAQGALRYFDDHDELYWNATGNTWTVPIRTSGATVYLPKGYDQNALRLSCYTGAQGSKAGDCVMNQRGGAVEFGATGPLTVVVGWQKGIVAVLKPKPVPFIDLSFFALLPFLLPILSVVLIFLHWKKHGREHALNRATPVQYDPPAGLRPAEVGAIMDQTASASDLAVTVVDLAVRGFVNIHETTNGLVFKSKDYELSLLKPFEADKSLRRYERRLLTALFLHGPVVKMSTLKENHRLYDAMSEITAEMQDGLTEAGYYDKHPEKVRAKYVGIGIAVGIVVALVLFQLPISSGLGVLGALGTGLPILVFGWFMPRMTHGGALAVEHANGFREYLSRAEKYRLKWQEQENMFETFLPFAMAFGVVDKWTKALALMGIKPQQPGWYVGAVPGNWNVATFGEAMKSVGSSVNAAMQSAPQSSGGGSGFGGGGFSGGGGGGGGGGSW